MKETNDKIEKIADLFIGSLSSFKEIKMQRVKLSEKLRKLDIDIIVELLHLFVIRSEENDTKFKPVISCMLDIPFLVSSLGNARMSEIYTRLGERGYYNVMELLVPHPGSRSVRKCADEIIGFPDMEEVPLGVKKSMAKSDKKRFLDKLIYEENPIVIKNLLNNPKITEKEVLKIVTKRPIIKEIIMQVVDSKRWIDRYIIKKAIILNPYTPTEIALNLLHFMLLQDLTKIASDTRIHYSIKNAAMNMIEKKKKRHEV